MASCLVGQVLSFVYVTRVQNVNLLQFSTNFHVI